jgi:hemerythrin-like domain-containing protein
MLGTPNGDTTMDKYLKTGVKSLIEEHPPIGDLLDRYGIGCVPCTVGTCKLEDVVKFHHLAPGDRAQMMYEIEKHLYPDRDVPVPDVPDAEEPPAPRVVSYSPPVRQLVEEHKWIKRLLAVLPAITEDIERSGRFDAELMRNSLDFIRGYADRFHHLKEEDILFDFADKDEEIIKVIYQDHDAARGYVRAAAEAIGAGDAEALCSNLRSYRELLTEHIAKEDDVLYPYLDRNLSTSKVGELFRRFAEAESQLEADIPERYQQFVVELERTLR